MIPIYYSSIHSVLPAWKRAFDIVVCGVALPLLAALIAIQFVATMLIPGPMFFRQVRVGYQGHRFCLYKFRTMSVSAPTAVHQAHFSQLMRSNAPLQKLDAVDSRLLPGAWLWRATGLDELPQIINVLRGEMSIVGPRPCIPYEYDQYSWAQRERLNSVPGLTGLWQVSGKNRTTFDQMVQLDVAYAQRCCPSLDLKIVLLTLPAIMTQVIDAKRSRRVAKGKICAAFRVESPARLG